MPANAAVAPKVYDVFMKLEGIALTDVQVGDFMEKLKRSSLFKEVNLIYTEQTNVKDAQGKNEETLRKFQIELTLNPNAEVVNPANPNTKTTVEVAGAKPAATGPAGANGTAPKAPGAGGTASAGGN